MTGNCRVIEQRLDESEVGESQARAPSAALRTIGAA
jgi:hypothetical protein